MKKIVLLDIMLGERYITTIAYPVSLKNVRSVNDVLSLNFDYNELTEFVEHERPSLIGKDYKIAFTDRRLARNRF